MYWPSDQPFWMGAIWGNVFCVLVLGPLGYAWSKTKFWPLNALHHKMDALHQRHDETHERLHKIEVSLADLHDKHDRLMKGI